MKIILGILLMAVLTHPLYAVELVKDEGHVKALVGDFDCDGAEDNVFLLPKEGDTSMPWKDHNLEVRSKGKSSLLKDIITANERSCGLEIIVVSSSVNPFIGVSYASGMHGWQVTLFSFDGEKINEVYEVFSDAPSIEVKDVDNDGENEIITVSRDYWQNPITDHFINTHKYDGNKWNLISKYETRTKKTISFGDNDFNGEKIYRKGSL